MLLSINRKLESFVLKYDLIKDAKGIWTGESAPQDEGFHYYQLNIQTKTGDVIKFYISRSTSRADFDNLLKEINERLVKQKNHPK